MAAELAAEELAGRSYTLQYEYPPRILPVTESLSLRDLGAGAVLEIRVRLTEPADETLSGPPPLDQQTPAGLLAASPASAVSASPAEFIVASEAVGLQVYRISDGGAVIEKAGEGAGAAAGSAVAVAGGPGEPGGETPGYMAVADLPCGEVVYGACGTNIVWWTKRQNGGSLRLQQGGSVPTGETDGSVFNGRILISHCGILTSC